MGPKPEARRKAGRALFSRPGGQSPIASRAWSRSVLCIRPSSIFISPIFSPLGRPAHSAWRVESFEDAFFGSHFTHSNNPKITRHPGGPDALWTELLDGQHQAFPTQHLTPMGRTLGQFVARITKGRE